MFDLRRRGMVGELRLAGTNGRKFPEIIAHMDRAIGEQYHASKYDMALTTFPNNDEVDPSAYKRALETLPKGSAVTIFTPDDTHYQIALDCVRAGMHVLVTKPVVKTLEEHAVLAKAAEEAGVLVAVEVHKRWDPIYTDARDRLRKLGDFSYMTAYMSQPKIQLSTFKAWAGLSSDISYYLNSHHVDFCEWTLEGRARPLRVIGMSSNGVAVKELGRPCEDTISLHVTWENLPSGAVGIGSYTSSWIAPPSDVHSQQRFHAMAHGGEVMVDQAHRGFSVATDASGYASANPLFMKYTPDDGKFVGQNGYGYRSFECFIAAVNAIRSGKATARDYDHSLASVHTTYQTTAILDAGRKSLDAGGVPVEILYEDSARPFVPTGLRLTGGVGLGAGLSGGVAAPAK
jgi:D-galacturonate reductase